MANVVGTNAGETLNGADGVTNGADTIYGLDGNDFLYGNGGADMLKGGGGADYLNGGSGNDTANYTDSGEGVFVSLVDGTGFGGTAEGDTLFNIENLTGSSHDDTLVGDAGANILDGWKGSDTLKGGGGADTLNGGNGNDLLKGGGGADALNGGNGIDTVSYIESDVGVVASLATGLGANGDAAGDSYSGIENLTGSHHSDTLLGDDGNNVIEGLDGNDLALFGGKGADSIFGGKGNDNIKGEKGSDLLKGGNGRDDMIGGNGNDTLNGGKGNDDLKGGEGDDAFVFDTALNAVNNVDTIDDFKVNHDKIWLDKDIFSAIGNNLGNGEFVTGNPQDNNDYISYKSGNGKLFYDADGAGGADKVLFARIDSGLNLDANDFMMI